MKATKKLILISLAMTVLQGCSAQSKSEKIEYSTTKTSSASIIEVNEKKYADLYHFYKNRSGVQDAKNALKNGMTIVKVFYAGRGGIVIPAFDKEPKNCQQESIVGMGDVIYGAEHMKYRKLMRDYAKDYNQIMRHYCH
ncbi:MAG: hypothetical protein V3V19_04955 [Cocleimonas sp.]